MSFYLGSEPVPQAILRKESTTLTAGQTVISTGGYTDGDLIQVSLNGVILEGSGVDYTASNGSDITLTVAGSAGDVLQFQTFDAFELVGSKFSAPTITNDVTLKNDTEEDTDGGRSSKLVYKGEQSGGEISTLAEIEAGHDGTADDEKGSLSFKTNDGSDGSTPTTALTINSEQKIGIGTQNPSQSLHIAADPSVLLFEDTGGGTDDKKASLFVNGGVIKVDSVNDDDSVRLNDVFVADLGTGDIRMGDQGGTSTSRQKSLTISHQTGASSEYGGLKFLRAHQNSEKIGAAIIHERPASSLDDSDLVFKTSTSNANATERWRITHDGHFKAATNGLGIDFSAAETSNQTITSSVLDDYEEGVCTISPTYGNVTFNTNYIKRPYIKIGRMVTISIYIQIASESGSDVFYVDLPFTAAVSPSNGTNTASGGVMHEFTNAGTAGLAFYVNSNSNQLRFYRLDSSGSATWDVLRNSDLSATAGAASALYCTVTYQTA